MAGCRQPRTEPAQAGAPGQDKQGKGWIQPHELEIAAIQPGYLADGFL